LDLPFFCGPDDMININFINYLIKSGGGYFQNSKKLNSNLFKAVLAAYIQSLLKNDYIVEMCLEKQRSRSGKI
jgi:glycerol-3-phosphate O-acyltransferase